MTDNAPITISGGVQAQARQLEQVSKNNPWVFNSSIELGRRFKLQERFFVEPQAQLNYSYMRHRDLALSETLGDQVNQWTGQADADESLMGRVGVAVGYTFMDADKSPVGGLYARVNYHREFLGQLGIKLESAQSNASNAVEPALSLALPYRKHWLSIDSGITHQIGRSWLLHGGAGWTFKGIADRAWNINFGARYVY